jgi:hypothetical protein
LYKAEGEGQAADKIKEAAKILNSEKGAFYGIRPSKDVLLK